MSDTVSVIINGQEYVSKAARTAGDAIDKLDKKTTQANQNQKGTLAELKMGWIAFAAIAVKAAREIGQAVGAMNDAYAEQETNMLKMEAAARTNPLLTGEFAESMRDWAESQKYVLGLTDDQIESQAALAGAMGRTEEQIQAMTTAARALEAAGRGSFEQNMQQLTRTFEGQAGMLGRYFGEIKNFTKAELEAGAAVDLINRKMAGMADAAMKGLAGSRKYAEIAREELNEAAGGFTAPVEKFFNRLIGNVERNLASALNAGFSKADPDAWFRKLLTDLLVFQTQLAGFFANLEMGINRAILQLSKGLSDMFGNVANSAVLQKAIDVLSRNIGQGAADALSRAIEMYNKGATAQQTLSWYQSQAGNQGVNTALLQQNFQFLKNMLAILPREVQTGTQKGATAALTQTFGGAMIDRLMKAHGTDLAEKIGQKFANIIGQNESFVSAFHTRLNDVLINRLTEKLGNKFIEAARSVAPGLAGGAAAPPDMSWLNNILSNNILPLLTNILNSCGVIGMIIAAIITFLSRFEQVGKVFTNLIEAMSAGIGDSVNTAFRPLADVMTTLGNIVGQILTPIFNSLAPILQFVADLLSMVMEVLQPLIDLFTLVSATVGPLIRFTLIPLRIALLPITLLFTLLRPVLELLARAIIWLYNNVIVPIANFIIFIFNNIYQFIVTIINGIIDAINFLFGWLGVNIPHMESRDDTQDLLEPIDPGDYLNPDDEDENNPSGSNVTTVRVPDNYFYIYLQGPIIGAGGPSEAGMQICTSIQAYIDNGGRPHFLEAPA